MSIWLELAARRPGVNSDHEGVAFTIYKIEIPIYRFFRYFFFGIQYFSVFGIPTSVSVSVTDPGLVCSEQNDAKNLL